MQQLGFKLTAEDVYSVNHHSMKDAIVLFGGGCTAELVSSQGLLLTNHHCGYSYVQRYSTLEHNYLHNGFWAKSHEEEIPCEGLSVTFLVEMRDVSEAVSLVLQAGAMAQGGEIFVLDMGEPVKITTLAENLIRMYGKVPYKDVEIKFTGLRPGEKLFEELLMDEEGLRNTTNKKIFIGNQLKIDQLTFMDKLNTLRNAAAENNAKKTVQLLADLVPTFHHNPMELHDEPVKGSNVEVIAN